MNIEWDIGLAHQAFHNRGAKGNVRNEVPVHDIDMDQMRAASFDGLDVFFKF